MPANGGHFRKNVLTNLSDRTDWLGREDSNLRMAESKSDNFSFEVKAHSEKHAKIQLLSINRLSDDSECDRLPFRDANNELNWNGTARVRS